MASNINPVTGTRYGTGNPTNIGISSGGSGTAAGGDIIYTGSGFGQSGRMIGTPVYKTILDEAGYKKYVEAKTKEFEAQQAEEQQKASAELGRTVSGIQTKFTAREKIKRQLEAGSPSPVLVGRIQAKREDVVKQQVVGEQARVEQAFRAKMEKAREAKIKEIEAGRSQFERKEFVGYDYTGAEQAKISGAVEAYNKKFSQQVESELPVVDIAKPDYWGVKKWEDPFAKEAEAASRLSAATKVLSAVSQPSYAIDLKKADIDYKFTLPAEKKVADFEFVDTPKLGAFKESDVGKRVPTDPLQLAMFEARRTKDVGAGIDVFKKEAESQYKSPLLSIPAVGAYFGLSVAKGISDVSVGAYKLVGEPLLYDVPVISGQIQALAFAPARGINLLSGKQIFVEPTKPISWLGKEQQYLGEKGLDVYLGTRIGKVGSGLVYAGSGALAADVVLSSKKSLLKDPLGFTGEQVGGVLAFEGLGKFVSKVGTTTGLTKPIISYPEYSPLKSTRIGEGGKFVETGGGLIKYQRTTRLDQLLKRKPVKVEVPIEYKFDVSSLELGAKVPKVGKQLPVGSPYTVQELIPQERLGSLLKLKEETIIALKTPSGFETKGMVTIGKGKLADVRIISELSEIFPKKVRVRTSPIGLDDAQTYFQLKTASTGEELMGSKIKGLELSKDVGTAKQLIRYETGPKVKLDVTQVGGKVKGPFEFEKIKAVKVGKRNILSDLKSQSIKEEAKKIATDEVIKSGPTQLVSKVKIKPKDKSMLKYSAPKTLGKEIEASVKKISTKQIETKIGKKARNVFIGVDTIESYSSPVPVGGIPRIETVTGNKIGTDFFEKYNVKDVGKLKIKQVESPSIKTTDLTNTIQDMRSLLGEKTRTLQKEATLTDVAQSSLLRQAQIVSPTTIQAQRTIQAQKVSELLKQQTLTKTKQITRPVSRVYTKIPIPKTTVTIPKIGVKLYPVSGGFRKPTLQKAFTVSSRVKGKEIVLAKGLTKGRALQVGSRFAMETTARSFKIKPVGLTRQKDIPLPRLTQFRTPVKRGQVAKEGFTFVEKSRFAIDMPEELKGITFKGQLARKTNKKLKIGSKTKLSGLFNTKAYRLLRT